MNNVVHSFWSRPCLENRYEVDKALQLTTNIVLYATSFAWAKKLGRRVVFYGDKYACRKFSIIPYDEIRVLDIPQEASTAFWAQSKFYALKQMQLGDVHIDGDVFIRSQQTWDIIDAQECDAIVQSIEEMIPPRDMYYARCNNIAKNMKFLYGCTPTLGLAFNCGVVGINNRELKSKYLETYFHALRNCPPLNDTQKRRVTMDLLFEQRFLCELSDTQNYSVRILLGATDEEIDRNAEILNYQHVVGRKKYEERQKIEKELEYVNKKLYRSIMDYIPTVKV